MFPRVRASSCTASPTESDGRLHRMARCGRGRPHGFWHRSGLAPAAASNLWRAGARSREPGRSHLHTHGSAASPPSQARVAAARQGVRIRHTPTCAEMQPDSNRATHSAERSPDSRRTRLLRRRVRVSSRRAPARWLDGPCPRSVSVGRARIRGRCLYGFPAGLDAAVREPRMRPILAIRVPTAGARPASHPELELGSWVLSWSRPPLAALLLCIASNQPITQAMESLQGHTCYVLSSSGSDCTEVDATAPREPQVHIFADKNAIAE